MMSLFRYQKTREPIKIKKQTNKQKNNEQLQFDKCEFNAIHGNDEEDLRRELCTDEGNGQEKEQTTGRLKRTITSSQRLANGSLYALHPSSSSSIGDY